MSKQGINPIHLKQIKIEKYKCFDSIDVENLGQFNIITGDNNIGKTSLLEAILLDYDINFLPTALLQILYTRSKINFDYYSEKYNYSKLISLFSKDSNHIRIHNTRINSTYSVDIYGGIFSEIIKKYNLNIKLPNVDPSQDILIVRHPSNIEFLTLNLKEQVNNYKITQGAYMPYITSDINYSADLISYFTRAQKNIEEKKNIENFAKILIPSLQELELMFDENLSLNVLGVRETNGNLRPLHSYGTGSVKFVRILLEIYFCKNLRLLIDEIDTGIYYKRFNQYWLTILRAAKINNVQLFVTTHSKECLDYLIEVMEELGEDYQKELRYINMYKNKEDNVISTTFNYEEFNQALENENEIR